MFIIILYKYFLKLRENPKEKQVEEIINYCKEHDNPKIDKHEEKVFNLNVEY